MKLLNKIRVILISCVLAICVFSCKDSETPPAGLLSAAQMRSVMIDLYLFEGSAQVKNIPAGDTLKNLYYSQILAAHGITQAQYDSSLVWFVERLPMYEALHKQVLDSLEARRAAADTTKQQKK
ncbi:MAG: DUF4296 domain-containing protein [Prevotellaceae bacterium]|jgi:hypothetical protein|nr:DUF4296 domain-containing protein [Prevotellaceae bacterium]